MKHACRTLLKTGNKRALRMFGIGDPSSISIKNLALEKDPIKLGEYLRFSFDLVLEEKGEKSVRLEYGIYFMKANGKLSRKIFKLAENKYKPGKHPFKRKHIFQDMTTRKHFKGEHQISIIVNGEEKEKVSFNLI